MKKIFYEKVGKRYKPVREYNNELIDSFHEGATLVICKPYSLSYTHDIVPDFAPMIAAAKYAETAISSEIVSAMSMKPVKTQLTERQLELWKELNESFKGEDFRLYGASAIDGTRAGIKAMEKEAEKMLENPVVKRAYEHFMLVWKLTKESNND